MLQWKTSDTVTSTRLWRHAAEGQKSHRSLGAPVKLVLHESGSTRLLFPSPHNEERPRMRTRPSCVTEQLQLEMKSPCTRSSVCTVRHASWQNGRRKNFLIVAIVWYGKMSVTRLKPTLCAWRRCHLPNRNEIEKIGSLCSMAARKHFQARSPCTQRSSCTTMGSDS